MSTISARIERMPFSSFHRRLLLMGGLGYTFDAMDAAVLAFLLPVLRTAVGADAACRRACWAAARSSAISLARCWRAFSAI